MPRPPLHPAPHPPLSQHPGPSTVTAAAQRMELLLNQCDNVDNVHALSSALQAPYTDDNEIVFDNVGVRLLSVSYAMCDTPHCCFNFYLIFSLFI